MVPKIEEWNNGTAYGVTPPTQVTSVNVEGIEKSSPIPRSVSNLQPASDEVKKELNMLKLKFFHNFRRKKKKSKEYSQFCRAVTFSSLEREI